MKYKTMKPQRTSIGSAGYVICSPDKIRIMPGRWTEIDTGVRLEDTDVCTDFERWFLMLVPISGLSNKYGLKLRNTVGIIDMDYRDTIKVEVTVECVPCTLEKGDWFLQAIIMPFGRFENEITPIDIRKDPFGPKGGF